MKQLIPEYLRGNRSSSIVRKKRFLKTFKASGKDPDIRINEQNGFSFPGFRGPVTCAPKTFIFSINDQIHGRRKIRTQSIGFRRTFAVIHDPHHNRPKGFRIEHRLDRLQRMRCAFVVYNDGEGFQVSAPSRKPPAFSRNVPSTSFQFPDDRLR